MPLQIARILHAGYWFKLQDTQIVFDPLFETPFSRNCHAFPPVEFALDKIQQLPLSAVFISHFHDDHCSLESLDLLDRETPIYLFCPHAELFSMIRELGFRQVYSLELNQSIQIGPFNITPRRALDEDVDSMFHIQVAGLNILNVVDSWIDFDTLQLLKTFAPWDLILWPFQTMRELEVLAPTRFEMSRPEIPPEWLEQLSILKPKALVPSSCQFQMESWSWYNSVFFPISYKHFAETVQAQVPLVKIIRLDPSQMLEINHQGIRPLEETLDWVNLKASEKMDYVFNKNTAPQSTSEIAQHFPPLNKVEAQRIKDFCEQEILLRYRQLDISEESYFNKTRLWKLSIYTHDGQAQVYHYLPQPSSIERIGDSQKQSDLAWATEIPAARLYGALECGESLTSIYLRINAENFNADIEQELKASDIFEDPLLRCLYHDDFASYQKAQLRRLKLLKETLR